MPLRLPEPPHIDLFHSSIIVNEEQGVSSYEVKIKNCWELRYDLLKVSKGDFFNIKGVGKIKVLNIHHYDRSHEYDLAFYERVFFCMKVSEWSNPVTTLAMIADHTGAKQRLQDFLRDNFVKTWGKDEVYVE